MRFKGEQTPRFGHHPAKTRNSGNLHALLQNKMLQDFSKPPVEIAAA